MYSFDFTPQKKSADLVRGDMHMGICDVVATTIVSAMKVTLV
jgi:hypothetical protein